MLLNSLRRRRAPAAGGNADQSPAGPRKTLFSEGT
jgi:hypothetical protein